MSIRSWKVGKVYGYVSTQTTHIAKGCYILTPYKSIFVYAYASMFLFLVPYTQIKYIFIETLSFHSKHHKTRAVRVSLVPSSYMTLMAFSLTTSYLLLLSDAIGMNYSTRNFLCFSFHFEYKTYWRLYGIL